MPYGWPHARIPQDRKGADGTRYRAEYARRLIRDGVIEPEFSFFPQREGLGPEMVTYFGELVAGMKVKCQSAELGWGTTEDIANGFKMIRAFRYSWENPHVIVVTDRHHMRRVKFVTKRLLPTGWTAEFHASEKSAMSPFEVRVLEPLKLVRDFFTVWKWRYRYVPIGE